MGHQVMRIYGQHQVIKLGNQTNEITAQYRFIPSYLMEITVVLTNVDINNLFLSLRYCISTVAYSHFNTGIKVTDILHTATVTLCLSINLIASIKPENMHIFWDALQSFAMANLKFLRLFTQLPTHRKQSPLYRKIS